MKKGQFQIGFGMIFSVILIVAFIVVAFIGINWFLGLRCSIEEGLFKDDFQKEVNRIWQGAGEDKVFTGSISGCKVEKICFWDYNRDSSGQDINFINDFRRVGDNNLFFYPRKESNLDSVLLQHIDMEALVNNPTCFGEENGKFNIRLEKDLGDSLVRVS
jgi:hypothetical protein